MSWFQPKPFTTVSTFWYPMASTAYQDLSLQSTASFLSWQQPLESLDLSGIADLSAAGRGHTISLDHLRPVTHDSWKLTTTHSECTVASIFGSDPPFWISPSASIAPFTEGLGTNHPNWFSASKNLHELCSVTCVLEHPRHLHVTSSIF